MPASGAARADGVMHTEPAHEVWARRAVTIPVLYLATLLYVALSPVLLLAGLIYDVVRRRDLVTVRALVALGLNLVMHCVAIGLLVLTWLSGSEEWDRRLEIWWAAGAYRSVEWIFRMETEVEGIESLRGGPILLFPRHASIIDTLLPLVLIAGPLEKRVRYVAKRQLLFDPAVDIIGHRLPFAFVRRGTPRHGPEIAAVVRLLNDLEPKDVVLTYPEGTRFTEEKRARFLASLEAKDHASWERAKELEHLLPPHAGGLLALLEMNPGADVVFCAHTGLEGANHLIDFFEGSLLDAKVRVRFWRVPYAQIPKTRAAQLEWFYDWWQEVDRWVGTHQRGCEWRVIEEDRVVRA